jgi:O-antigen/teichoic acid export membrane protein
MIVRRPSLNQALDTRALLDRLRRSAVVWSWLYNGARLASGIILLPLVLRKLPEAELGMYYVLLSLVALVPLVDFGFGPTIGRFVSYAMGGAEEIQPHGIAKRGKSSAPNYDLLWQLLFTTRRLYSILLLVLFVVLGLWGTYMVELRIQETASPTLTRLAWGVTFVSALFDIYAGWWGVYLSNMNQVLAATRIGLLSMSARLVIACGLLLVGGGLLSLPIGSFCGSLLGRALSRRRCLHLLAGHPPPRAVRLTEYLKILWPNSWRAGIYFISGYLIVNANTAICLRVLGLAATAQYGLSVQLAGIVASMSAVWINVKWPIIGQYLSHHDLAAVQRVLRPRLLLQILTFLLMAGGLIVCGPVLLQWFGNHKTMLPSRWLVLLLATSLLETQFSLWTTLIFAQNRMPFLWFAIASNVLSLTLSQTLIHFTSLGLGALVLAPLLAGTLFNYWYWPSYGARSLGTSLGRFLFRPPPRPPAEPSAMEPVPISK